MEKYTRLLRIGVGGLDVAAVCCLTPALLILLGVVGRGGLAGYLDYVLLPALALFMGIAVYAWRKRRQARSCCVSGTQGEQP